MFIKFKKLLFKLIIIKQIFILLIFSNNAYCKNNIDENVVNEYKKLKSKNIILNIESGIVYVMVGVNRWDIAPNKLKLVVGDKLKVMPSTIASINFYDEFDINLSESELITIEPYGIVQMINGAMFKTTYKNGIYVSEVIKAPSKINELKFKGIPLKRDLKSEYSKTKTKFKTYTKENEEKRQLENSCNNIRLRVMQAKNFGNEFNNNLVEAEYKIKNDKKIMVYDNEKEKIFQKLNEDLALSLALKKVIDQRTNDGILADNEKNQLNLLSSKLDNQIKKFDYINETLKNTIHLTNDELNLTPKLK